MQTNPDKQASQSRRWTKRIQRKAFLIGFEVVSPGVVSQPPLSSCRFLGRRPFVRSTIAQCEGNH